MEYLSFHFPIGCWAINAIFFTDNAHHREITLYSCVTKHSEFVFEKFLTKYCASNGVHATHVAILPSIEFTFAMELDQMKSKIIMHIFCIKAKEIHSKNYST